jgi:hypothetical protein
LSTLLPGEVPGSKRLESCIIICRIAYPCKVESRALFSEVDIELVVVGRTAVKGDSRRSTGGSFASFSDLDSFVELWHERNQASAIQPEVPPKYPSLTNPAFSASPVYSRTPLSDNRL